MDGLAYLNGDYIATNSEIMVPLVLVAVFIFAARVRLVVSGYSATTIVADHERFV